ncbi:uncharacterized protein L201_006091 [Kwoniella dendrophila CBS 6074]|uniref:Major facilitator superfamily (MFS) profile domain-containing protein n=1 Tax=Kwoniella dendrophila CBS 6074 TaxID=1295534 RepID=A0AAX4K0I5_9TREE
MSKEITIESKLEPVHLGDNEKDQNGSGVVEEVVDEDDDDDNKAKAKDKELRNIPTNKHEIGLDLYQQSQGYEYTPAENKTVLRKIDWRILPIFCVTQGLAFLDKTAINYGNLFGMKAGVHVSSSQFKFNTGKVMGIICIIWGIICACTAACRSFASVLICRLLLGCLESAVTPGLGLMTPLCFNGWAGIVGGLSSYGIGHSTSAAIPTWALIFVVFGCFTAVWGIVILLFLPDTPASAKFLTQDQKIVAIKRVAENRTGTKNTEFKWNQVREAFLDPKTYFIMLASATSQIPNAVVTNFSSQIVNGFGFSQLQTTLLDIPQSTIQIVSLVLGGYIASKFKNIRCVVMFVGNIACVIAACCLTYLPRHNAWGRLVSFWFTGFSSVGFSLAMVMISSNVGGYTKRQTMSAINFIGYCVGTVARRIGNKVVYAIEDGSISMMD